MSRIKDTSPGPQFAKLFTIDGYQLLVVYSDDETTGGPQLSVKTSFADGHVTWLIISIDELKPIIFCLDNDTLETIFDSLTTGHARQLLATITTDFQGETNE